MNQSHCLTFCTVVQMLGDFAAANAPVRDEIHSKRVLKHVVEILGSVREPLTRREGEKGGEKEERRRKRNMVTIDRASAL